MQHTLPLKSGRCWQVVGAGLVGCLIITRGLHTTPTTAQVGNLDKTKYKLQKIQIQTTKKTNTNYKKTKKTKPQRYARIWINNKKRSPTSQFSCPLFGLFGIVQINDKICKLEKTTAPTLFTTM